MAKYESKKAHRTEENAPPMKPSQVFLGDNYMSLWVPKKNPKI